MCCVTECTRSPLTGAGGAGKRRNKLATKLRSLGPADKDYEEPHRQVLWMETSTGPKGRNDIGGRGGHSGGSGLLAGNRGLSYSDAVSTGSGKGVEGRREARPSVREGVFFCYFLCLFVPSFPFGGFAEQEKGEPHYNSRGQLALRRIARPGHT